MFQTRITNVSYGVLVFLQGFRYFSAPWKHDVKQRITLGYSSSSFEPLEEDIGSRDFKRIIEQRKEKVGESPQEFCSLEPKGVEFSLWEMAAA